MTWTNFDCMDVLPVSGFQGFSRSLESEALKEREKYDSRQKLFLYPVSAEQGLLSPENAEGLPLIMLTVLDLEKPPHIDTASYKEILCQCLEASLKPEEHVKGQLYGCLSIYDYALVLRGNSYAALEHMLAVYRRSLINAGIYFRKTYTISGLNLEQRHAWKEPSDLRVSVRLSCSSQITVEHFQNDDRIRKALKEGYEVFSVLGKYDYDIVGEIRDTDKFVQLFWDEGALSPANTGIHKTNTRFMLQERWEPSQESPISVGNLQTAEAVLNNFISRKAALTRLCPSIQESLLRLILRLFQASTSINDKRMRENLWDALDCFLDFLNIHQAESDQQDEFARINFIRAGWNRQKRNAAYFWSMSRVMAQMLKAYIADGYIPTEEASPMESFLKILGPEESEGAKFDQYRNSVCQYCQSILIRCTYDYNGKMQIPHSHAGTLLNKVEDLSVILQKIYEESIADIFMIHVLGIDDLDEYLRIQHAYYEPINRSPGSLPLANISRIIAVSIVIRKWDSKDYEGIKENFSKICDSHRNDDMEPMLRELKEYERYYMIEPLVVFLDQVVEKGLGALLREEGISGSCEQLRQHYQNLKTGSFAAFLDFIDNSI
nr:hypothetical protein [uncultured Acetatifactor sp.]